MIADSIRTCFPIAAKVVADKAEDINKLNVFPVPDGDTGTNMSLTLETVVCEIEALPAHATMDQVAHAITHGSLMGARGNSGVITSQILRGIAQALTEAKGPDVTKADIVYALKNSVKVTFKAVRKPVAGTILTVIKDLSIKADELSHKRISVTEMLEALVVEAYESVARTPDLLPILKENGVVDSGAYGLAIFFEAFVNAYVNMSAQDSTRTADHTSQELAPDAKPRDSVMKSQLADAKSQLFATARQATQAQAGAKAHVANVVDIEINDDWEGSQYRYCTEFLFHAKSADFDEKSCLRYLASQGDCELLVGANPDYKVHVHTNRPDYVLRHMLHRGQISNVFVHNMDLEAKDRTAKIAADKGVTFTSGDTDTDPQPRKNIGFVAVAAGPGQAEILKSLGVDVVISGGQTMNPAAANILDAIEHVNADAVIVLPNNGNIRMTSDVAAEACQDKHTVVVPTKTVPQAFSALFAFDPDASLETNIDMMISAISCVRGGEVTTAVRDSQTTDGSPIHKGDVMGIQDDAITVVGSDVIQVTCELITRMQDEQEGDTLTLLAGEDLDNESFEALKEAIATQHPDLDIDTHRGDQPLYPVVFSIE